MISSFKSPTSCFEFLNRVNPLLLYSISMVNPYLTILPKQGRSQWGGGVGADCSRTLKIGKG